MKKFILKCLIIIIPLYAFVVFTNYYVDPANLFNDNLIDSMTDNMIAGNIIVSPGDVGEGQLVKSYIEKLPKVPDTVVIGSSHVMYIPFEYDNYIVASLSGAYLKDYLSVIGILEEKEKLPKRIVLGVDPWAFTGTEIPCRHISVSEYADRLLDRVYERESGKKSLFDDNFIYAASGVKELFSFSYFQSSLSAFGRGSLKNAEVKVVDSDVSDDTPKIMPNGRRIMTLTSYKTVEGMDGEAANAISADSIYGLNGFTHISDVNKDAFCDTIKYLSDKGIDIELYLPPWYPFYYDIFKDSPDFAGVLKVSDMVYEIGSEFDNVTVHGSYNPDEVNVSREDYADSFHLKPDEMLRSYQYIK